MHFIRFAIRRWRRRSYRHSVIGYRLWRPIRAGQRRSLANRARAKGSQINDPDRPGGVREAMDNGFRQTINLPNNISILAALSLQQEDILNRVRIDSSRTFHLEQIGQGAILKSLYGAGQSWHQKKSQGLPLPTLRTKRFALLITETKARLILFAQDPDSVKAVVDRKVMNPDKHRIPEMESQRAKTRARSRPQRPRSRADIPDPPGIKHALQR